jgi:hypothetical protein
MTRLLNMTEDLESKYNTHAEFLDRAKNTTTEVLEGLESARVAIMTARMPYMQEIVASWWPYIVFPGASVVLGNYGLSTTIPQNLGLACLGELMAVAFCSFDTYVFGDFESLFGSPIVNDPTTDWSEIEVTTTDEN